MQIKNGGILFSPSDLITFMESAFASHMERSLLQDHNQSKHMDQEDKLLANLQKKGYAHEDAFLTSLISDGKNVVEITRANSDVMLEKTKKAMADGADVIAQAYLSLDNFSGMADFLMKIPGKSRLGNYHYEVWDTKLSKKMKPYFAIQLCCYSEMLKSEQGIMPEKVAIVLGNNDIIPLKIQNYFGYYLSLKFSFLSFQNNWKPDHQPNPAESSSNGRWSHHAGKILEERRHLSLVANITRTQMKRLERIGINTIDDIASTSLSSVPKLSQDIFERLRIQAQIQISSEGKDKPDYKVLPHGDERSIGLSLIPPHSDSDVFFDIEGFPLIEGGLEYLWGATYFSHSGKRQFKDLWAHNPDEEKEAFSDFIDWIFARWSNDSLMHVYHYASYEVTALRNLMGRYGIREYEVDTLLRNGVFVDLYNVIRNGVLIGEPSYSLKNVEHLYRDRRDTEVANAGESVIMYDEWRANPDGKTYQSSAVLNAIREYNIDDCNSTQELTQWLRHEQLSNKISYLGPTHEDTKRENEEQTEVSHLRDQLLRMADNEDCSDKKSVMKNLAWILEFHKRENKPTWWRLFDRLKQTEIDLRDDMDCLVDLQRTSRNPFLPTPRSRNQVFEFSFDPNQPFKETAKSFYVLDKENTKVTVNYIELEKGLIGLQSKDTPPVRLSLVPDHYISPHPIPNAILDVIKHIIESDFSPSAIVDFLLRTPPKFFDGPKTPIVSSSLSGEAFIESIISATNQLNSSYLCIQGPPGAGKTYTAQNIIVDLMSKGKRIGISSNSHKAVINLMSGVADYLLTNNIKGQLIKVGGDADDLIFVKKNVKFKKDAKACGDELNSSPLCIGGTAWVFCNAKLTEEQGLEKFDYLFIDEAGQVSIANLIGMSRIAKNIILIGDQMQLGQPMQGSHPDESGQSILEYLLEDQSTVSPNMGVFLPMTYRMNPAVCRLLSDQVYDGRLNSTEDTKRHIVDVPSESLSKNHGIHFMPVIHEGNTQGSEEEVEAIQKLTQKLIGMPYWPKKEGDKNRSIGWTEILFVAPYNYQVNLLKAALDKDARVGSVDKFQGQEAPIVFVSMCASDASESPRGIDFLFSKERLNVAISRAQSLAIVVGSPKLATTPVSNIRQMELVNFYAEIVRHGSQ